MMDADRKAEDLVRRGAQDLHNTTALQGEIASSAHDGVLVSPATLDAQRAKSISRPLLSLSALTPMRQAGRS
jgi:hypothetical protein